MTEVRAIRSRTGQIRSDRNVVMICVFAGVALSCAVVAFLFYLLLILVSNGLVRASFAQPIPAVAEARLQGLASFMTSHDNFHPRRALTGKNLVVCPPPGPIYRSCRSTVSNS